VNVKQVAEIDALMQQHDARTEKLSVDQRAEDEFAAQFGRLRREVIKPAMEQVAEKLKAGGHHAAVEDAPENAAQSGEEGPGTIRLEILPSGAKRDDYKKNELPGVTFSAQPGMKVGVCSRSGPPGEDQAAGPTRRFRLREVTADMVTTEIVAVLRKTF